MRIRLRQNWLYVQLELYAIMNECNKIMNQGTHMRITIHVYNVQYAVKVRRHTPWSRGPLAWIPGMLVHALSISFATAQSSYNSEIYNKLVHLPSRYTMNQEIMTTERVEWRLDFKGKGQ